MPGCRSPGKGGQEARHPGAMGKEGREARAISCSFGVGGRVEAPAVLQQEPRPSSILEEHQG